MTTYTTYQAGKESSIETLQAFIWRIILLVLGKDVYFTIEESYYVNNILVTGFLLTTFTLANLPLSVLDYMALTTP